MKLGIWPVRPEGEALANALGQALNGTVYRPWLAPETSGKLQFAESFFACEQWILIMTTGIAVRYLQGLPQDKRTDPAAVVIDEGGRFAVSFLSGHEGGANLLAYGVANATGAVPVITTATETQKPLIIGLGCRKNTTCQQIDAAICKALEQVQRNLAEVRLVATIDHKENEPGLQQWCGENGLPLHAIQQGLVAKRPWVTKPSDWVHQNLGVVGVCEPCALLASVRGELLLRKTVFHGVALAIVEDPPIFS